MLCSCQSCHRLKRSTRCGKSSAIVCCILPIICDHSMFIIDVISPRMDGKTGTTRRNINYLFGAIAITHLWMITGTINIKLESGTYCDIQTFSPYQIKLEAVLIFSLLLFMLFAMKVTIAYVLNEFNDTGGLKSSRLKGRPSSRLQRAVNW